MADTIPPTGLFGDSTQLLNFLNGLFGTNTTQETNTSNTLDPNTSALLTQFLSTIMPELTSNQFSPEAADKDSQGAIDSLFRQFRESLPNVFGGMNSAGAYNSSTAQLLANDAFSRTVGDASKLKISTEEQYAALRDKSRSQVVNLLLGLLAATKQTRTNTNTNNNAATKPALAGALGAGALRGATAKPPAKPNNTHVESKPSDKDPSEELQKQIDANDAEDPPPDDGTDITKQIMDAISGGDGDITPEDIPPVDGGDVNDMNTPPDFDFSDSFNFGDNSFDFLGDGSGDSGDSSDDGSGGDFGGDLGGDLGGGDTGDATGDEEPEDF